MDFIRIYTMTHKKFEPVPDPMYVPLQVGSSTHEHLGYLHDDSGDNISDLNCYYSELTGLYWLWKNVSNVDYIGTCHYRRFLIDENDHVFNEAQYRDLLGKYDLITTKKVHLNNSYHFGFSANHNIKALDETGQVIKELYPEYYDCFDKLVNGPDTYFGNIFVTSKKLYDEYCSWLFSIFFEVAKRIDLDTDKDDYHKRVFGFISEFLLYVWCSYKQLKVYECKVGMLGEKVETAQIKKALADFLAKEDIDGAKAYFLEKHKKRPDILMEASDITGELHIAMQIIATADAERKAYGHTILEKEKDFAELVKIFSALNGLVSLMAEQLRVEESEYIKSQKELDKERGIIESQKRLDNERGTIKSQKGLDNERGTIKPQKKLDNERGTIKSQKKLDNERGTIKSQKKLDNERGTIKSQKEIDKSRLNLLQTKASHAAIQVAVTIYPKKDVDKGRLLDQVTNYLFL